MYFANRENFVKMLPSNLEESAFDQLSQNIFDTEPEELRNLPLVLITGSSGEMITGGLGDMVSELYDEHKNLIGYRYGGMYRFSLVLEIATRDTLEREVLADIVSSALRFGIRRQMESKGVLIENLKYGGESVLQYNSDNLYVSTLNVNTWSEWYEDHELLPVEKITIDFDI